MRSVLVFASNTDCGKTLMSGGLVRAAISKGLHPAYFKPVQTGVTKDDDTDAAKVKGWTGVSVARTLFCFQDPVSPHLAAQREDRKIPSFDVREKLTEAVKSANSPFTVIETAGGVLSPFPDETLAADALQIASSRLNMRTILVGDARLGGISQTLAALEALEARRYDVCSLVLFSTDDNEKAYGNEAFLKSRLIKNPPVRRINTPIPKDNAPIPREFFNHPVFDELLSDILDVEHDKRQV